MTTFTMAPEEGRDVAERRGNREGSFRWEPPEGRRKFGRWKGRLLISGVGLLVVAGRKGESKASVRERLFAKRDEYAGLTRPTKGTLAEWTDLWLRLHVRDKAPRTRDYYRAMLGYVLPALGSRQLGSLAPEEVLVALDGIERPATRRKAYEVLRIALNRAVRTGRLKANPCSMIDPPEATAKVVEPPSADDARRILAALRDQRDEALIVTALATGLRQGELVGLRWKDLEVGDGRDVRVPSVRGGSVREDGAGYSHGVAHAATVHVRGQLDRSRTYVRAKRGSERVAILPPVAAEALARHRQRVTLAQGRKPDDEDYIFTDAHGRPMTGYEAYRRWKVAFREAGVAKRPMHSARHFAHSKLEEAGLNGPMIDALFGHRDERMRARYTHATDEARAMAADVMDRALREGAG